MAERILIVEDEKNIARVLELNLPKREIRQKELVIFKESRRLFYIILGNFVGSRWKQAVRAGLILI